MARLRPKGYLGVGLAVAAAAALALPALSMGGAVYVQAFDASGRFTLGEPRGVIADSRGDVYVAATGAQRIVKFDPEGRPLSVFGNDPGACGDPGHLCYPQELTYANDHIYVADWGGPDVQIFTPEGRFVKKFGSQGDGEGQFLTVDGIASNCAGDIFVSDARNHLVQEFDPNGNFIRRFGVGELTSPIGIAVATAGGGGSGPCVDDGIYVADEYVGHIVHFSADGKFIGTIGTMGSGPLQFNHPEQLAIDWTPHSGDQTMWVADSSNNRAEELVTHDSGRSWAYEDEITSGEQGLNDPAGVALGPRGEIYVSSANLGSVYLYADRAPELLLVSGNNARDRISATEGLFVDVKYNQLNKQCHVLITATVTVAARPSHQFTARRSETVGSDYLPAKLDLSRGDVQELEAAWKLRERVSVVVKGAGACSGGVHVTKTARFGI